MTSPQSEQECLVSLTVGSVKLAGTLEIPTDARGLVLLAYDSGSSRHQRRDRYITQVLHQAKWGTLLINLLTPAEEMIDRWTQHFRFDLGLLAERLVGATQWLRQHPAAENLKIGYFSGSTGSAAALLAAVEHPEVVDAVVSCGGQPDLAGSALSRVQSPTLLIVGENDVSGLEINQTALVQLHNEKQLEIISGATYLFEEPSVLAEVTWLASQWFERYLTPTNEQDQTLHR